MGDHGVGQVQLITFVLSPFGRKVEIALRAKGIPYHVIAEKDLCNKSPLLVEANPVYKKIPVLLHNGRSVCESRFIVEYIEETWPSASPHLLPPDPYDRYLVRFWADFLDLKIRNIGVMCADDRSERLKEEYGEIWAAVETALPALEARGNVHDGKNHVNYLDACMASWIPWIRPLEICGGLIFPSGEERPCLQRWIEALSNNSIVKSTFPSGGEMMAYARRRFHMDYGP